MKYLFIVMLVSSVNAFAAENGTGASNTDVCTKVSNQNCDAPKKLVNGNCTNVDSQGNAVKEETKAIKN
ncbi:MAG: hypothetical protein ACOYL6_05285 [Bacteriovoracaceae bacterium]